LRGSDRLWLQSLQEVLIREFLKNFSQGIKNSKFYADFKTDEKVAKKFT
jgi:hypothetical protein